jgi:hypothetical protein
VRAEYKGAMHEKPPRHTLADQEATASPTQEPASATPARRRGLHAIYLGARTIVIGPGGVTVHRHTRGSIDRNVAVIGYGRQRPLSRG